MLRTIVPNTPKHGPDVQVPAPRSTSHLPFPVAPATFFQQKSATTKDPAVQFLADDGGFIMDLQGIRPHIMGMVFFSYFIMNRF